MTTEIDITGVNYGYRARDNEFHFEIKTDDVTQILPQRDGGMIVRGFLKISDALKIRDYLNEKYPGKHDTADSHRFDEPEETGLYVTQSGRIVIKDARENRYRWNYVADDDVLYCCSWKQLCRELPEAEFPLRRSKAVAE